MPQPVEKFPAFNGTIRFIIMVKRTFHLHPSWARLIQTLPVHCFSFLKIFFDTLFSSMIGQDSSVSIDLLHAGWCGDRIQTGSRAHLASYTKGTRSFPVVKQLGCDTDYPPPPSKGKVIPITGLCGLEDG